MRLYVAALVRSCSNTDAAEELLRAAVCLSPPNSSLVGEATDWLRKIRAERRDGSPR